MILVLFPLVELLVHLKQTFLAAFKADIYGLHLKLRYNQKGLNHVEQGQFFTI